MSEPFEGLGETLLRAGVAPGHVRRYLRELSEHVSDLTGEELQAGRSTAEARAAARARLGAHEALADAVLAQPALRSWTGRAPWATLVVGPVLLLVLAWVLACVAVILLVGYPAYAAHTGRAWLPPEGLPRAWVVLISTALLEWVQVGGPLLIACGVARLAARQRSRLVWPLLGCLAVALFGASLSWTAHWPGIEPRGPLGPGGWSLSLGFRGYLSYGRHGFDAAVWTHSLALASFILAAAGSAYWWARRRSLLIA